MGHVHGSTNESTHCYVPCKKYINNKKNSRRYTHTVFTMLYLLQITIYYCTNTFFKFYFIFTLKIITMVKWADLKLVGVVVCDFIC